MDVVITGERRINRCNFFITLYLYAVLITDCFRQLLAILGLTTGDSIVELVRNLVYLFVFFGYYYYTSSRARTMGFLSIGVYFTVLLISILCTPQILDQSVTLTMLFVFRNLLGLVIVAQMENPITVVRQVVKTAWLVPIYVFLFMIAPHDLSTGVAYSMSFSYNLLLPAMACVISFYVLREKSFFCLIIFIIALLGIVAYGSRGTILCIGIGAIYIVFFLKRDISIRNKAIKLICIIALLILLYFFNDIITFLASIFSESRTLLMLQNNNIFSDSGRDIYAELAKTTLEESPFHIFGLGGDTYYYSNNMGTEMNLGNHSHNLFRELLVSYGILFGGVLCSIIIFRIVISLKRAVNDPSMQVICALFLVPFLPYILISGSTCQSFQYWLLIGAIVHRNVFLNKSLIKLRSSK